jgi:hypothetical protein
MATPGKIVLLVLTMAVFGQAMEDQEKLIQEMSRKILEMEKRLSLNEEKLVSTQEDLLLTKAELKAKNKELEREVSILQEPPFLHICGTHYNYYDVSNQTINYGNQIYYSNNIPGAELDMETGAFTGHTLTLERSVIKVGAQCLSILTGATMWTCTVMTALLVYTSPPSVFLLQPLMFSKLWVD